MRSSTFVFLNGQGLDIESVHQGGLEWFVDHSRRLYAETLFDLLMPTNRELKTSQQAVTRDQVKHLMGGWKPTSGKPTIYKYKNELAIYDGNHRLTASFFNGEEKVEVNILDVTHSPTFK